MVREDVSERSYLSASGVGALPILSTSSIPVRRAGMETQAARRQRKLYAVWLDFDLTQAVRVAVSTEADRGTPFLFIPVFFEGGSVAYFMASREPAFTSLFAGAVALAALALLSRSHRPLRIAFVTMLTIVLGVLAA